MGNRWRILSRIVEVIYIWSWEWGIRNLIDERRGNKGGIGFRDVDKFVGEEIVEFKYFIILGDLRVGEGGFFIE